MIEFVLLFLFFGWYLHIIHFEKCTSVPIHVNNLFSKALYPVEVHIQQFTQYEVDTFKSYYVNSSITIEIFKVIQLSVSIKKDQISRKANLSWIGTYLRPKKLLIYTLCVLQVVEEVCAWKFYFWLVRCLSNCIPECLKFIPCDAKPWRHIRNSRLTE